MPSDYPMPNLSHGQRQCILTALLLREKELEKILKTPHEGSDYYFQRELEETRATYNKIQSHFAL